MSTTSPQVQLAVKPAMPESSRARARTVQRKVESAGYSGNQTALRRLSRTTPQVQRKLAIGSVNDPLEEEADRVADQVMRMPDPGVSAMASPAVLRRKCPACDEAVHRKCASCEEEDAKLQKRSDGRTASAGEAPPIVHEVLSTPGQALDRASRGFLEPRFGVDLGKVRIHSDARAAESAQAVGALAYTVGRDVVFGSGRYSPATPVGRHLIAHELAHVAQQRGATGAAPLEVGASNSPYEREADSTAQQVTAGEPLSSVHAVPPTLQRQDADDQQAASDIEPTGDVQDGWRDKPLDTPNQAGALSQVQAGTDGESVAVAENESPVDEGIPTDQQPAPEIASSASDQATELQKGAKKGGSQPKKKPKPFITHIEVDLAKQSMTVTWSDNRQTTPMTVSTGTGCPNTPDDPCKTGNERFCTPGVTDVHPGQIGDANTDNGQMAWYVGVVDTRSIGIHNSQDADGKPKSHGCVRTGQERGPAREINQNVKSSTTITFTGKAPTKPFKMSKAEMKTKHYEGCPEPVVEKPAEKSK